MKILVSKIIKETKAIILIIIAVVAFRTFILDWNYVPSASMEPNLLEGDIILVDKISNTFSIPYFSFQLLNFGSPERGDIITFIPPHKNKLFVKRVVGLPGDEIKITNDSVYVNGKALPRNMFSDSTMLEEINNGKKYRILKNTMDRDIFFDQGYLLAVIPEGKFFVLGDNRDNSMDSRYWGFVDKQKIMGIVRYGLISFSERRDNFVLFEV